MIPLIDALKPHVEGASKTTLKSLLTDGRVLVETVLMTDPRNLVKKDAKITILPKLKAAGPNIKIYYEDTHICVVYKPENLLTVDQDIKGSASLHSYLKSHYKQKITPVHRLDRGTSGVLVFAISEKARDKLKELFFHHEIVREYVGIVHGIIPLDKGRWIDYLEENEQGKVYIVHDENRGKKAVTQFEVLDRSETHTLVRFTLETGRKHQIRVQSSSRGYPLVGDDTYGGPKHKRILLHAQKLEFQHPITGKMMRFFADTPDSFKL